MARRLRSTDDVRLTAYVAPIQAGEVELLIHDGHYQTRAQFLRSAIGRRLEDRRAVIDRSVQRNMFEVGRVEIGPEQIKQRRSINILGTAVLDPALIKTDLSDFEELRVYGAVVGDRFVLRHFGRRLVRQARAIPIAYDD